MSVSSSYYDLYVDVFPIGMYGMASRALGAALGVPWLVTLGRAEAWPALAAWALVVLAWPAAALRHLRRGTAG